MDVDDLEVGQGLGRWILVAIFLRRQPVSARMGEAVLAGDARHDRILEDDGRVAMLEIASIDAKADEQRIGIRAIVIGDEDLVEAAIVARQRERRATSTNLRARGRDPE